MPEKDSRKCFSCGKFARFGQRKYMENKETHSVRVFCDECATKLTDWWTVSNLITEIRIEHISLNKE